MRRDCLRDCLGAVVWQTRMAFKQCPQVCSSGLCSSRPHDVRVTHPRQAATSWGSLVDIFPAVQLTRHGTICEAAHHSSDEQSMGSG